MNKRESNVVSWPHVTVAPITAAKVLAGAIENGVEPLLAVGYGRDGKLYVAGTHSEVAENLMLLRMAVRYLEEDAWREFAPNGSAA